MPARPTPVTLTINHVHHDLAVEPRRMLLDAFRHDLELTGTKRSLTPPKCCTTKPPKSPLPSSQR